MKKIIVISFTKKGGILNERICQGLRDKNLEVVGYGIKKYTSSERLTPFIKLSELMKELFYEVSGIIFVGACGIAVRGIAPFIKNKKEDPAVVVVDEGGEFAISLLSGHMGGANELSRWIGNFLGAKPVITTATDVNGVFAVDTFAMKNKLAIEDISLIKEISGAVLNGEKVGFFSEYPTQGNLPKELILDTAKRGICIASSNALKPFSITLNLVPQNIVLGIGCKRGTKQDNINHMVKEVFKEYHLDRARIGKICSIDVKKNEAGILQLAEAYGVEFYTYSAKLLKMVQGDFMGSPFVEKTVGVDNVCERSAAYGSNYGMKLIPKTAYEGITLSAYEMDYKVDFM